MDGPLCHKRFGFSSLRNNASREGNAGPMGVGTEPERWTAALDGLREPVSHLRSEALDALGSLLASAGWVVEPAAAEPLLGALGERLQDSNWSVCQKALSLVGELLGHAAHASRLDDLASELLAPGLLAKAAQAPPPAPWPIPLTPHACTRITLIHAAQPVAAGCRPQSRSS